MVEINDGVFMYFWMCVRMLNYIEWKVEMLVSKAYKISITPSSQMFNIYG